MSAPRFRLELATRAQRDIKSIRAYSVSHWGEEQADLYLAAIAQGFETLCIHPEIGRAHEDWQPKGVRSYQVREHLIVYRLKGEVVNVLRVVHRKRDVSRLFGRSLR